MSEQNKIIDELYKVITDRKENPVEGSYTNYLFSKGSNKICKKVGEEAVEVIISATVGQNEDIIAEIADLTYHVLVLMAEKGITPEDVSEELRKRQ